MSSAMTARGAADAPINGRGLLAPSAKQAALLRAQFQLPPGNGALGKRGLANALGVSPYIMRRWAHELGLDTRSDQATPQAPGVASSITAPAAGGPTRVLVHQQQDSTPSGDTAREVTEIGRLPGAGEPILSDDLKQQLILCVRQIAGDAVVEMVRAYLDRELPVLVSQAVDKAAHRIACQAVRELLTAVVTAAVE